MYYKINTQKVVDSGITYIGRRKLEALPVSSLQGRKFYNNQQITKSRHGMVRDFKT